jgi:hypothetical protein
MENEQLARTLGRLEGKCDAILARLDDGSRRMDDHSKRIRVLESWRWLVLGGAGAVAFLMRWLVP